MKVSETNIVMIPVDALHPHPDNPRKDLGDLTELTDSIQKNGIMQNLTVVPKKEGKSGEYTVIIGHRRFAAAQAAGLKALPCAIRDLDEKQQFAVMMEENMQRQDLTVTEQAYGFQMMFDWGYSVKDIAEKTGFSEATINHRLQIAKLDKKILQKRQQDDGEILQLTISDLYELEKIKTVSERNRILEKATDSKNLRCLVEIEVTKEVRQKNAKAYIRILEGMGITEAPKEVIGNRYSYKYENIGYLDTDKSPGKTVKLEGYKIGEKAWYIPPDIYNGYLYIYKKAEKTEKKEKTKQELKKEKAEADRKKLEKIKQSVDRDRKAFINGIVEGKYQEPKDTDIPAVWRGLVWAAIGMNTQLYPERIGEWILGKRRYNWTDEEKEQIRKTESRLTPMEKLMILTDFRADDADIIGWDRKYDRYNLAEAMNRFHTTLGFWGFSINDEEQIKVLDGTHELYVKGETAE